MTVPNIPALPRPHGPVDTFYMEQLVYALENALELLNRGEPVKNNVIVDPANEEILEYDGETWRNVPHPAGLSLSSTTPADVSTSAGAVGTGTTAARDDHVHKYTPSIPVEIPSGTTMLFYQDTIPTGWSRETPAVDDHALKVDTTTTIDGSFIGSKGGANVFTTAFGSAINTSSDDPGDTNANTTPTSTGNRALTIAQLAVHNHTYTRYAALPTFVGGGTNAWQNTSTQNTSNTGSGSTHNHTIATHTHTMGTHNHTFDNDVKYINVFLASKN